MNDDLSSIFEKLNIDKNNISPEMIDNIMNMVNNFSQDSSEKISDEECTTEFDIETILKIKSIIDKMKLQNNNPRTKLLQDLKPYLTDSKRSKIDQYIKLDRMMELLPLLNSDIKSNIYSDNQVLLLSLISLLF